MSCQGTEQRSLRLLQEFSRLVVGVTSPYRTLSGWAARFLLGYELSCSRQLSVDTDLQRPSAAFFVLSV